jgi:hypothetical protein
MTIGKIDGVGLAIVSDMNVESFEYGNPELCQITVIPNSSGVIFIMAVRDDADDIMLRMSKPQVKELVRLLVERL